MANARRQAPRRPQRPRKAGPAEPGPRPEPATPDTPAPAEPPATARAHAAKRQRAATAPADASHGKSTRARRVAPEARRQAILAAALTVFATHGFEAARLDDVARGAGIAKGTLYLYFRDKEALFEALVRDAVSPLLEQMSRIAAAADIPPLQALETFFALFQAQVLGTERKLLLRLVMAEGPRFPAIAEFYHREVVSHGLRMLRALAQRAAREGAFATDAAARFPQLIVAPLLLAVLWDGLFAATDPLDVGAFLRAHREMLTGAARKGTP